MSAGRSHRADDGSIMLIVLVTVLALSTVVLGIVTFAGTVVRVQNRTDPASGSIQAADGALRMAITLARDNGPSGCFTSSTTYRLNGLDVTVTCDTEALYSTGSGRLGVITTSNAFNVTNLAGRGSGFTKDIEGQVFYNAGNVRGTNSDILVRNAEITYSRYATPRTRADRYRLGTGSRVACTNPAVSTTDLFAQGVSSLDGRSYTHTHTCTTQPWWEFAGDAPDGDPRVYPPLPPIPTYSRSGSLAAAGSCRVYYPGRYYGANRLILDGGRHYFASGVYYFERDIEIRNGARVVMGEGRLPGCSYDAEAAVLPTAPRAHEITGRGATLLLGNNADLVVTDSSLEINRRVSTSGTRGSEGVAIRTVNGATATNAVEIPEDRVRLSDGSTQALADHSIQLRPTSPVIRYTPSVLGTTARAVDVQLNGSAVTTNRFVAEGYVFTPNTGVRVTGTVRPYRLWMNGGVVAANLTLNLSQAPTSASDWLVGAVNSVVQRKMLLTATVTENGVTRQSRAVIEVHQDRSTAVNSWISAS
jgi:hypothetical protein